MSDVPTYVCDGCMRRITPREVAIWADFEHVLCHDCRAEGR